MRPLARLRIFVFGVADGEVLPFTTQDEIGPDRYLSRKFRWTCFLPANLYFLSVEPRGFEPLTSAVQSQNPFVATVRLVQKILQNSVFLVRTSRHCSPSFAWVGVLLVYTFRSNATEHTAGRVLAAFG